MRSPPSPDRTSSSPSTPVAPADGPALRIAVAAIVLVGVVLRVRQFAFGRPFWLDELFVALNVSDRSFLELLAPLAWDQSAPVLFLWAERLALLVGGNGERVLRTPSLVAGCALLALVWLVGRRILGAAPALLALLLAAVSPYLVYFSNELKPYGLDAAVALALVAVALRVLERPADRTRWAVLAVAGVVALPLSSPAVFTLAAVGAALLATAEVRRTAPALVVGLGVLWAVAFATVYLLFLRHAAGNALLRAWFEEAFLVPGAPDFAERVATAAGQVLLPPLYGTGGIVSGYLMLLLAALGALGVVAVWRRAGVAVALLLVLPALGAAAASATRRYPIEGRTMLYAAPFTILLVAAGVFALTAGVRRPRLAGGAAWVVGGLLALPALALSAGHLARPVVRQDARPAIAYLRGAARGDDALYLNRRARAAWAYYAARSPRADSAHLAWLERAGTEPPLPNEWAATRMGASARDGNVRRARDLVEVVQRYPTSWVSRSRALRDTLPVHAWASSESARLRNAAPRSAWVLMVDQSAVLDSAFLAAVRRDGGRVAPTVTASDVVLYRVDFPPPRSARNSHVGGPAAAPERAPAGGAR